MACSQTKRVWVLHLTPRLLQRHIHHTQLHKVTCKCLVCSSIRL
ncbi:Uncharacterised protein [Vibrio cholerae]|nr:Uncharacterised protein [Vibrio cholerae]CSI66439.1 Uncharacterised protein [Vibrio cholerae]